MAIKLNIGTDFKRSDMFMVDPFQLIVKEGLRGRWKPPTEEAIVKMAKSMKTHGQRQPVEVRKVEDNRLQLTLGFTRTAAARLIRNGFEDEDGNKYEPDTEFKLKVVIVDGNDKDALIHNIIENAHRNDTSPIDDAQNHQRLRDQYGYSDADIKGLYEYKDPNKVGRLRRLLSLDEEHQQAVHDGTLTIQAALDLLDMPPEKRGEIVKAATNNETGKVSGSKVRAQVRDRVLADPEGHDPASDDKPNARPSKNGAANKSATATSTSKNGAANKTATPPSKALSIKEIREFLLDQKEKSPHEPIQEFADAMLAWIAGKRKNASMQTAIKKLYDA